MIASEICGIFNIFQGKVGVLGVLGVSVEWQHLLLPLDCGL
jgi:hypothetical protein